MTSAGRAIEPPPAAGDVARAGLAPIRNGGDSRARRLLRDAAEAAAAARSFSAGSARGRVGRVPAGRAGRLDVAARRRCRGRARRVRSRAAQEPGSLPVRIGEIEALVAAGALPEGRAACAEAMPGSGPGDATLPLLVACGEAEARSGQPIAAYGLYRQAAARAPERAGITARAAELRAQARDQAGKEAQEAAARKDWAAARLAGGRAIEIDPDSAARPRGGGRRRAPGGRAAPRRWRGMARPCSAIRRTASSRGRSRGSLRSAATGPRPSRPWSALPPRDPSFEAEAEEARLSFRLSELARAGARGGAGEPPDARGRGPPRLVDGAGSSPGPDLRGDHRERHRGSQRPRADRARRRRWGSSTWIARRIARGPTRVLTFAAAARLYLSLLRAARAGRVGACLSSERRRSRRSIRGEGDPSRPGMRDSGRRRTGPPVTRAGFHEDRRPHPRARATRGRIRRTRGSK